MKTNKLSVLLILLLCACAGQKEMVVEADKSLEADFDEYNTFAWASSVDDDANLLFWLNDAVLKDEVREAIAYELDARGYELVENNPDLLVNFRVFDEDTEFRGYTGADVDNGYWENDIEDAVREEEDVKVYNLQEGTLLVDLVDTGNSALVWQGYASGVIEDQNMYDPQDDKIKDAVQLIFAEYDFRADKSTASSGSDY